MRVRLLLICKHVFLVCVGFHRNSSEHDAMVSPQETKTPEPKPAEQVYQSPVHNKPKRNFHLDRAQEPFIKQEEFDEDFPGEDDFVDGQHGALDYEQERMSPTFGDNFLSEHGERFGGVYGEDFDEEDEREVTFEEAAEAVGGMVAAQSVGRDNSGGNSHSLGLDITKSLTEETRKYLQASQEDLSSPPAGDAGENEEAKANGHAVPYSPTHKYHLAHHRSEKASPPGHNGHHHPHRDKPASPEEERANRREEAKAERIARLQAIQEFYNRNPSLKK